MARAPSLRRPAPPGTLPPGTLEAGVNAISNQGGKGGRHTWTHIECRPDLRVGLPVTRKPIANLAIFLAAATGLFIAASACGFRSSPDLDLETGSGSADDSDKKTADPEDSASEDSPDDDSGCIGPEGPFQLGGCGQPFVLLDDGQPVAGYLSPCADFSSPGWCGGGGGTEQVFSFTIPYSRDVTIYVDSANFAPLLRVVEKPWDVATDAGHACIAHDIFDHEVCGAISPDRPGYAFFASKDTTYYVIVDSHESRAEGAFTLQAAIGPSDEVIACEQRIEERYFLAANDELHIENEWQAGQGHMANWCGGAGNEHIYQLEIASDGYLQAWVQTDSGQAPLVTVQTDCESTSILAVSATCNAWDHTSNSLEQPIRVDRGSLVYLIVDHMSVESAPYTVILELE